MASIKLKHSGGNGVIIAAPTSNPASDKTLTLPSDVDGTVVSKDSSNSLQNIAGINGGQLGNRNLVINGAMQVAQRGDVTGANSSGYKALDRFRHTISIGTWSISQSTDSPDGFANSMKMDCTTAEASPASASALAFVQKIEGQNLQHLKKGTSGALNITVSFHIKCTKTGTAVVNLIDEDNTRMIGQQFTINSADTWEKKTLTFAGDTSGVLGNDANSSLRLEIWLDAGSSYKSGSVQSSWATLTTANYFAGGTLNLGDNTSNDVFITGVQLEVGDTATDFEHRSFAQELALCQRYFLKRIYTDNIGPYFCQYVDTHRFAHEFFPCTMRTVPSITATFTRSSTAYKTSQDHAKFYTDLSYDSSTQANISSAEYSAEL